MSFPEFEPGKKRLLFFVRGRGRGHAIPDLAIVDELLALRDDVEVRLVSYATGSEAIKQHGRSLIDLPLPESGSIPEMSVIAGKLIGWLKPDLVVSHEEFAAIPAAAIFSVPSIALTDWFTGTDRYSMGSLRFAEEILFLGTEGTFPEPPWLTGKTRYVGTILRDFQYTTADQVRARRELSIPEEATVVAVFPGSWSEERTPLADIVLQAFDALTGASKRLIWFAGADREFIASRTRGRDDVVIFDYYRDIDRLMVAANVSITKTNRKTVFELRHLNVPTIAVTYGLNPPDDIAVTSLKGVVRLQGNELNAEELRSHLERLIASPPERDEFPVCRVAHCGELLSAALDRAAHSRQLPGHHANE
jgi:UDP-N-acetylglucosamine:LPS N-acetylglucosamine transferase